MGKKPGVPNYYRPPVDLNWERVFHGVQKESGNGTLRNSTAFPRGSILLLPLLNAGIGGGMAGIIVGSDAHGQSANMEGT